MKKLAIAVVLIAFSLSGMAQKKNDRVKFNNQNIFLNGANVAWIHFANDIGPKGVTDIEGFRKIFAEVHANGDNSMRLWLHTTGANTPEFNEAGMVISPGEGTIADLKSIIDVAWENKVGLMLCLWSFDMLRKRNGELVTGRAKIILSTVDGTKSYINNSLIPMVKELKGYPGILSWEIFNEPEGMSNEFGWKFNYHVPMSDIQRFINLCSGAIHRTDPKALVTNGSWCFYASTDVGEKNKNYYTDARLIEAGGDKDGILDFYTVHYYDWAKVECSPFHHDASYWKLDKPLVISEFHPKTTFGVNENLLYDELYKRGYAGAMAWSWTDSNHAVMLGNMADIFKKYPKDVLLK